MTSYATTTRIPKTLTLGEQNALLRVTGEHRAGYRDHMILSLALGTALREHELAALNVGDIVDDEGKIVQRFPLRVFKRSRAGANSATQETILPDTVRRKLAKFVSWKRFEMEPLDPGAPLFLSRERSRISVRRLRHLFATWQERAGFERHFGFHALRHTALTNLYRATKDLRLVQRVARHASVMSTTIYAQANDDDVLRAVRELPC